MFSQTASDLDVLRDAIEHELEVDPSLRQRLTPMLISTPIHHWRESRNDFAAAVTKMLAAVFSKKGELVQCPDCNNWRVKVQEGGALVINNGELSLAELERLRHGSPYGPAKSLALIEETPAGIAFKVISLEDGQIMISTVADSTLSINKTRPYLHLQQERERRLRGEALSYVFINLGLYPQGLFQLEYLEQWGSRNQYITGLGLSFFNPDFSLGAVMHYMLPQSKKLQIVGGIYVSLAKALQSSVGSNNDGGMPFQIQTMAEYSVGSNFGLFAGISTQGRLSVGFNLYNPLFLPFLL